MAVRSFVVKRTFVRYSQGMPTRPSARADVLAVAADRASIEGLEGLTIGSLAADLGMSKSGVVGLFGSKTDLQVATLRAASERFQREVVDSVHAEPGVERLRQLAHRWLDHVAAAYAGGCFFIAAAADLDGRPGAARDVLVALETAWIAALSAEAKLAVRLGELPRDTDPDQLAFELFATLLAANFWNQLLDDTGGLDRARVAIDRLTEPGA